MRLFYWLFIALLPAGVCALNQRSTHSKSARKQSGVSLYSGRTAFCFAPLKRFVFNFSSVGTRCFPHLCYIISLPIPQKLRPLAAFALSADFRSPPVRLPLSKCLLPEVNNQLIRFKKAKRRSLQPFSPVLSSSCLAAKLLSSKALEMLSPHSIVFPF